MIFADYPGHFIVAVLLAVSAGLVVLVFHCREMQKEKIRSYRSLLMGLRYIPIVILIAILCNPSQSVLVDEVAGNSVLALFDTSQSMSVIEDAGTTRLDKALEVFDETFHPSNANGPEFIILGFDSQVYHCGSTHLLRRWGTRTDLQSVLAALGKYDIAEMGDRDGRKPTEGSGDVAKYDKYQQFQVSKFKGAVIFTDGQAEDQNVTTYLPLIRDDFPIVIVGIGSKKHNADVGIKSVNAPARAAAGSVYKVEVVAAATNPGSEPVIIELLKGDKLIDSKQVEAELFSQQGLSGKNDVKVEFTVGADSLGSHSLLARARAVKYEVNPANNARGAIVEVVEHNELRVLFYTQAANFNVGKLRQVLVRDRRIKLDFSLDAIKTVGLSSEASKNLGYVKLPESREEFYKYDIIILGHCQLDNLTNEQIDGLYSFVVQRGGGLVLLPGRGNFGPAAWKNPRAQLLFPVIFDHDDPKIWPPNPCLIEFTTEAMNRKIIGPDDMQDDDVEISAFYRTARVKPAASILATSGGIPIITLHRVGRGRVCLLNISRLFMLYREDEQGGLLYKLISGLTSYIGKTSGTGAGVELFVERSDTQDEKIKFSAYVCDSSFSPVEKANVLLNIKDQVLMMAPTGRGYYVVESDSVETDTIIATAQAEIGGVFLGEKTIAVNLPPRRNEMADTQLNEKFMQILAERIRGTYIHADDIDRDIVKTFDAQTRLGTARRMASVWPTWPLFAVLCIILSVEWFLRRAKGLV